MICTFEVLASCPEKSDFDIRTIVQDNAAIAGGNHGHMDVITISLPRSIHNVPFKSIKLTYGEVASYWIPLETKFKNGRLVAVITGYPESIKPFEFVVTYSDGKCAFHQSRSVKNAYNELVVNK